MVLLSCCLGRDAEVKGFDKKFHVILPSLESDNNEIQGGEFNGEVHLSNYRVRRPLLKI